MSKRASRVALRREFLRHAPDRRDADAAGDEHDSFGVFGQRKIVARRADLDVVADTHLVENVARAAAARRVALDADHVALRIGDSGTHSENCRIIPLGRCRSICAPGS